MLMPSCNRSLVRFVQALRARLNSVQVWLSAQVEGKLSIHHIYYLLALFDIAAVLVGLLLTHHVIASLSDVIDANLRWSAVHSKVAELRVAAGRANAPGNNVFESRSGAAELANLIDAEAQFKPVLVEVTTSAAARVDEADWPTVQNSLSVIETAMSEMIGVSKELLEKFDAGDTASASSAMAAMDRHYSDVLTGIEALGGVLRRLENNLGRRHLEATNFYRLLELLGTLVIGIMVVCVTVYGRYVGHLFECQKSELASFNAELETKVADRTRQLAESEADTIRQKEELRKRNEQFDIAINNMNRGLCLFDSEQRLLVANRRYFEMYGLDPAAYPSGTALPEILRCRIEKGHYAGSSPERYLEVAVAQAASRSAASTTLHFRDGRIIDVGHFPTSDGGSVTTHDDVTERRKLERQIGFLADHDALTGLSNRRKLRGELEYLCRRADRGEMFAVLCLDLDCFKHVNDTLGHPVGDRLLQSVALRLKSIIRKSDLVARLGGDEFAIIQVMADQPDGASVLASRLIEELSRPYEVDGHQLVIGTSVGIAIAPNDGQEADVLIKHADLALYRAKSEGKGAFRLFKPEMDARAKVRRQLELDLRRALLLREFELFYQPLVDTNSGSIVGFEALLRWRRKDKGLIPPGDFIPLAEEIGLMGELGAWVLKTACIEAMSWPDHCRVAVNVSPSQFRTRQLDLDVMEAITASGLRPDRLELEITETVLLENTEATLAMLHRLRGCGIKIAMDDFGTGYSSLSYLHSFPFDKIKIDRSFTMASDQSSNSRAIVQAVVGLGKNLGMATTAEGVETVEQLARLRNEGCAEVQGYLFSKPVPANEIQSLIRKLAEDSVRAA